MSAPSPRILALLAALPLAAAGCSRAAPPAPPVAVQAKFVGRAACVECHAAEDERWTGSHHDLAMQEPTEQTVLGDFSGTSFTYHGVTSTFTRKDGRFFARTDGPDGALHDYEIAYTLGVHPLQQYLIRFPGGRLQALNVCWDTRPKEQGGQRWFHLYPDEDVRHDDVLHWTGPYQNWNYMCADCHSTEVSKGFDAASDTFQTTWKELDVSCEACHGPCSEHVAWGQAHRDAKGPWAEGETLGLVARLAETWPGAWVMNEKAGIARRDRPRESQAELWTCARCHTRRSSVAEAWRPGQNLLDTHRPALLERPLYHDDGQILEEVYEVGSFLQSRMHNAGVTCTDCHDPHTLKTPPGNAVCGRCHLPAQFDTPAHHHHPDATKPGTRCVECHMPTRDYMVVHTRHDHSFRVPRPDLSVELGLPNACQPCHADKSDAWAAETVRAWGSKQAGRPHWAPAFRAAATVQADAGKLLVQTVIDAGRPGIVRASAAAQLSNWLDAEAARALELAARDADPWVRYGAVQALLRAPGDLRARLLVPLLADPVRVVRGDAARALAPMPEGAVPAEARAALAAGLGEWRAERALHADRAESHLDLALLASECGALDEALREAELSTRLSPRLPVAWSNLADLRREHGDEAGCEAALREGLKSAPRDPGLLHALGLALVRLQRANEAVPLLQTAAQLAPDNPRFAYVYAIALQSAGQTQQALAELATTHAQHPGDADVLSALVILHRDAGEREAAAAYARKLVELRPQDPGARALLQQLTPPGPR